MPLVSIQPDSRFLFFRQGSINRFDQPAQKSLHWIYPWMVSSQRKHFCNKSRCITIFFVIVDQNHYSLWWLSKRCRLGDAVALKLALESCPKLLAFCWKPTLARFMVSEFEAFSQGKSSNIPELDNWVKSLGISTVFGFSSRSWFRSFGT